MRTWFKVRVSHCYCMKKEIPLNNSSWNWGKVFTGSGQSNQTLTRRRHHLLFADQPWAQSLTPRTHMLFLPPEEDHTMQRPLDSFPAGFSTHHIWIHLPVTPESPSRTLQHSHSHVAKKLCVLTLPQRNKWSQDDLTPGSTASRINVPHLAGWMGALISWTNTSSEKSITPRSFQLIKQMY